MTKYTYEIRVELVHYNSGNHRCYCWVYKWQGNNIVDSVAITAYYGKSLDEALDATCRVGLQQRDTILMVSPRAKVTLDPQVHDMDLRDNAA